MMKTKRNLKSIALVFLASFSLLLSGCGNIKLIEKAEAEEPAVETEEPKEIAVVNDGDNYVMPENTVEPVATPETVEDIDPDTETILGVKFKVKTSKMYFAQDADVYTSPTLQTFAASFKKDTATTRTALSVDGSIAQIKASSGRTYYVNNKMLKAEGPAPSTPLPISTPTPQPEVVSSPDSQQQATPAPILPNSPSNNGNNSTGNSGWNNGGGNSGNSSGYNGGTGNTTQACTGVCWPGGTPDRYVQGIGFISKTFTAYLIRTAYIYSSPAFNSTTEWLSAGTEVNCTGIGQNNFVEVQLANGAFVYIDGNNLNYGSASQSTETFPNNTPQEDYSVWLQ